MQFTVCFLISVNIPKPAAIIARLIVSWFYFNYFIFFVFSNIHVASVLLVLSILLVSIDLRS